MTTLWPWISIALGLVLLFVGGEGLVRGSAALALRLGMSSLVAGLTVVAFGTSSPELVVSVKAALDGHGAMAAGNVIGSNILNVGVILGLTALICPLRSQRQIVRFDTPVMILVAIVGAVVMWDLAIGRLEGGLLLAGLAVYLVFTVWLARRISRDAEASREFAAEVPAARGPVWRDLIFIVGGIGSLVLGSRFLVDGAVEIARGFGVSDAIIGLTIVAMGTSMPELAASIVAAVRGDPDVALGNIVGSNIFNVLCILGISALARPFDAPGISHVDLVMMVGFSAVLFPVIWTNRRFERWEGALFLAAYGAYLWFIWPKG